MFLKKNQGMSCDVRPFLDSERSPSQSAEPCISYLLHRAPKPSLVELWLTQEAVAPPLIGYNIDRDKGGTSSFARFAGLRRDKAVALSLLRFPYPINHQSSTNNYQPSTINQQPSTNHYEKTYLHYINFRNNSFGKLF